MPRSKVLLIAILLISIAGCDEDDKQVAQVAQESLQRQAEQNQEMAKLNREVATGTRRLVEADSKARQELIVAQKELAQQQADLARQHDKLEGERRDLAALRYRESLLAPVISGLGLLLLCALPLVLAWYLLQGWRQETATETAIGNLLLEELVSERPLLLPQAILPAPREAHRQRDLLTGPQDTDESNPEDAT
jgi:hypothetical protein